VTLPDHVTRAVVLQHQTLNLLVQLNAADEIVGVMSSWKKQLGPAFARFMPGIEQLPTPGDLTQVNIESLLALHPQVVFVANYAPQAMIQQIQNAGIPVVAISLRQDAAGEKNKMNPSMADEEQAYNEGLKQGIRLIGAVVDRKDQAETLIRTAFAAQRGQRAGRRYPRQPAGARLYGQSRPQYLRLRQIHRPDDETCRRAERRGGHGQGRASGSLEQVLQWNPQVIFVQDRYPQVVKQIESDPQWQGIDAVKNHRVWLMPEYAKAWGYPMPEALALGELWMAKKLYPSRYNGVDVDGKAQEYYQRFIA
jgi:iron complex transport system substrate-binding protein